MGAYYLGLLVITALAGSVAAFGQHTDIETSFDKRKSAYKLECFEEVGERPPDSEYVTRFDYLYYKDADRLSKIRVIESDTRNGKAASIKVDDYFFVDGQLRLVRLYFFISDSRSAIIKRGDIVPLITGEHIEFEDGKLSKWIALGKNIPPTDRRWRDKQTSVEMSLRVEIMKYESLKKPK
jgi:hypothetical protein